MKKRLIFAGIGIGALAYWLKREFQKSDHSVRGTVSTAKEDLGKYVDVARDAGERVVSAVKAGIEDFGAESSSTRTSKNRGNGNAASKSDSKSSQYSHV